MQNYLSLSYEEIQLLQKLDDPQGFKWRLYVELKKLADPKTGLIHSKTIPKKEYQQKDLLVNLKELQKIGLISIRSTADNNLILYLNFDSIQTTKYLDSNKIH